jgi:CBS domain-containing protein
MISVKHVLESKGHEYWSLTSNSTVYEAIKLMADHEIGSVLVIDGGEIKGIVTERDYARKVILEGKSSPDTPLSEIMSTHVLYVRPEQTVEECLALMTDKRVRHIPVITDGEIKGLVSIGDLVKAMITEQQFIIEQLANYIST